MSRIDGDRLYQEVMGVDNSMGIYPAAVKGHDAETSYEQRDGYKNGWNACVIEYGRKLCEAADRAREPFSDDLALLLAAEVGSLSDGVLELNMGDVWAWALAWGEEVPADQIPEVARLFRAYGNCGLLYWASQRNGGMRSEFYDNNRAIEFVEHEERIRREVPDYNRRAYHKEEYKIVGSRDATTTGVARQDNRATANGEGSR